MKPRDAKTESQRLKLSRDNLSTVGHWILLNDNSVTLTAQRVGESATASMRVPRSEFNRLIDWYMRDQKPRRVRRP